jgi:hypothetical protein
MSREMYVKMMSNPKALGNPLVGTQYLLGASIWEKTADGEAVGTW